MLQAAAERPKAAQDEEKTPRARLKPTGGPARRAEQTAEPTSTPTTPRAKRYAQWCLSASGPNDETKLGMI